jgi:hypothetical protein
MDRRVFDYRQIVSFLFTFCPLAYLADLSNAVLLTHFVCAKKNTAPADVFDFGQFVSFLFTFCPHAYLADLSNAKDTNTFSVCVFVRPTTSTCDSRARGPLLALLQLRKCAL